MSAPIARATSTGRLSVRPPSTSSMSPICAGAITPGTDMLARITRGRSPSSNTTARPVTRSVATARYGIGSWSKRFVPCTFESWRSTASSWMPLTTPFCSRMLAVAHAELEPEQEVRSSSLRRIVSSWRGGLSLKSRLVVIDSISLLHLRDRHAARVRAADERAHAGAGDAVDRHAQLLEHLEDADVRGAARAAAGEDEADLGAAGGRDRRGARRGLGVRRLRETGERRRRDEGDRRDDAASRERFRRRHGEPASHGGRRTATTRPAGRPHAARHRAPRA